MAVSDVDVGLAHAEVLREGIKVPEVVARPVLDASMHELELKGEHDVEEARAALQWRDVVEHGKEVGALSGPWMFDRRGGGGQGS